jgi:uncharacterized membrane protein
MKGARITRLQMAALLGFVLVLALINVLGMLALLVGLFVTIPITSRAFAHAYRALTVNAGPPPAMMAPTATPGT